MRRATPQQLGSICQRCAILPIRSAQEPLALRSIVLQARRSAKNVLSQPQGRRWLATATDDGLKLASASGSPAGTKEVVSTLKRGNLVENVDKKYANFLQETKEFPNPGATNQALQACLQAASDLNPLLRKAESQARASAGRLAQLGAERTGQSFATPLVLQSANERISQTAYNIVVHHNVEMTPHILEAYVHIQSQLGRAETLPHVLELYACKAKPVVKNGVVQYVPQNPNSPEKAIDKQVADIALQTAIDAKHLDAALGITEVSFCVKAFKRQKILKRSTVPAVAMLSMPIGIVGLSAAYATYAQNTLDTITATGIAVAAISGYFFVTGGLGMVAKLSNKDQMNRVTWLPGTPLRYRWMREEEREALDKIACAWGFKEKWRYGEESGPEWEGLREYMGYRQMILDRAEFMEGMN